MPEGPEVEVVKLELQSIINKKVSSCYLTTLSLKYQRYIDQAGNVELLQNTLMKKIERRAKFIIFWFDNMPVLNHLGMTGGWRFQNSIKDELSKYAKVVIEFEDNSRVIFDDMRNFGRFQVYKNEREMLDQVEALRTLGIDGLEKPFDLSGFENLLQVKRNQNKEIGGLLLDSRVVSGIGNIYKSESLFKAKINPLRVVNTLSKQEIISLGNSISEVLHLALSYGGSTINNFQKPFGDEGKAQEWHQVYNRAEKPCYVCESILIRIVQKNRSSFFCSTCQILPEGVKLEDLEVKKKKKPKKKKIK